MLVQDILGPEHDGETPSMGTYTHCRTRVESAKLRSQGPNSLISKSYTKILYSPYVIPFTGVLTLAHMRAGLLFDEFNRTEDVKPLLFHFFGASKLHAKQSPEL